MCVDNDIDHKLSLRLLCQSVISGKAGGLICEPLNAVLCGAPSQLRPTGLLSLTFEGNFRKTCLLRTSNNLICLQFGHAEPSREFFGQHRYHP